MDHDDFIALSKLRRRLTGPEGDEVEAMLRPAIVSYWQDIIDDDIKQNGVLSHLMSEDEVYDGERLVQESVSGLLAEYELAFDSTDVDAIAAQVDVAAIIAKNQERYYDADDEYEGHGSSSISAVGGDPVDDLFDLDGPMGGNLAE